MAVAPLTQLITPVDRILNFAALFGLVIGFTRALLLVGPAIAWIRLEHPNILGKRQADRPVLNGRI